MKVIGRTASWDKIIEVTGKELNDDFMFGGSESEMDNNKVYTAIQIWDASNILAVYDGDNLIWK